MPGKALQKVATLLGSRWGPERASRSGQESSMEQVKWLAREMAQGSDPQSEVQSVAVRWSELEKPLESERVRPWAAGSVMLSGLAWVPD